MPDNYVTRGLPANLDAERFILGTILTDDSAYILVAGSLEPDDFSLEKHRRIFGRMGELYARGERIDRVTLANELMRRGQLETVDGLSYLVSLDDGLPQIYNIDSYLHIVQEKARLRRVIYSSQKLIDRCFLAEEESAEIIQDAQKELLDLGQGTDGKGLVSAGAIIAEVGMSALLEPSKREAGVYTGFARLDEMTGGLRPGELIILAARPSMGKTAMALNIATYVATKLKRTVPIFSLEMSRESLLQRMLCASARVDLHKFRAGFLNAEERRQLQISATALSDAPLFIDDTAGNGLMEIHSKLLRLKAERGDLGLVVVDYLQLMRGGRKYESRVQEVSDLSRGLKLMAKDLAAPFLVLSQLSRAPETRAGDHRPQLSDLRESGSIEQDADLVAFVFREEVYKPDREDLRGMAELIISKQRNGPTGKVNLVFLHGLTKFENAMGDLDGPETASLF